MSPRAVTRLLLHRNSLRQGLRNCSYYDPVRCLYSIKGTHLPYSAENVVGKGFRNIGYFRTLGKLSYIKEDFWGVAMVKRGICCRRYEPEQLFNVVAAVDLYEDFLPWCQRSNIVNHNPDGSFDAELEIGFKFLVESYISHVELNRPRYIKTTSSQSSLFDHLINSWEFNPGPVPGSCSLYFLVDFKFQSPFYRQIANVFFKEVATRLVGSFHERCRLIYGPGVQVLEHET